MVDNYDCQLPELNEERTCDNPQESTEPKLIDTRDNAYDSATVELSIEVECDYPTGWKDPTSSSNNHEFKTTINFFAHADSKTPDMVDKPCELPELNEERTCDNHRESTDAKMIDTHDNVHDPSIIALSREVVYDYPTGVRSGEDEIQAVQVEMIPNPAYGTVTCSKEHV